jgi:hypothetical protein
MKIDLVTVIGIAAVFLMLINLFFTVSMRSHVKGGLIGKRWNYMTVLVLMFAAGYFILPFLSTMTVETLRIVVSMIFFFGALYVMITLRMIYGIIKELMA